MFLKKIFTFVIIILSTISSFTQSISNFYKKKTVFQDTIFLDNLLIEPNSLKVYCKNQIIDTAYWKLFRNNIVVFKKNFTDSITIIYRTIELKHRYQTLDTSSIITILEKNRKSKSNEDILSNNELLSNGTFMRGITVGTNQNAVLTNKMNLSIDGQISQNMFIKVQANDYTMPITPDGATQRIDELNNVSLELYSSKWKIAAGDITTVNKSFFSNFEKQIKGIAGQVNDSNYSSSNYIGLAKGRYNRQIIIPQNGIQGPYQLTGANNETYIFILEKSVRVILDGIILKENDDYQINYSNSQITFSNKNIIISNSRIEVYFEYSERFYNRFVVTSTNKYKIKNTTLGLTIFSQIDNKNNPIDLSLNDTLKEILYNVGDSTNNAIWQNYKTTNFEPNLILYKLKDSIIDDKNYKIFEYSLDNNEQLYIVNFSFVGQNMGSYIVSKEIANARIYKFVGMGNGQYEPYTKIVAPQKKQLIELTSNYQQNKFLIHSEISLSNFDYNTFSPIDDNNNIGSALKFGLKQNLNKNDTLNNKYYGLDFMNISKNFNSIENIFNTDFYRFWNLNENINNGFSILSFNINNRKNNSNIIFQIENLYCQKEEFIAIRPKINFNQQIKSFELKSNIQTLFSKDKNNKSFFETGFVKIIQKIKKSSFSINYSNEVNYLFDKKTKALSNNAFMTHTAEINWKSNDSTKFKKSISYIINSNFTPLNNKFNQNYLNKIFKISLYLTNKSTKLKTDISYNNFENKSQKDTTPNFKQFLNNLGLETQIAKQTILISLNNTITAIKEPLFQFVFIEVEPAKGTFMWIDYNNDKVQQTDEFEIAHFADEGKFIKIPLNSNKYIKTYNNKTIGFITINPSNLITNKSRVKKLLEKIKNTTNIILENKSPQIFNFSSNNKISETKIISNNLNFNLTKKVQTNYLYQKNNSIQSNYIGTEENTFDSHNIDISFKLNNTVELTNQIFFKKNIQINNYSINRNFELNSKENIFKGKIVKEDIETEITIKISQIQNQKGIEKLSNYEIISNTTINTTKRTETTIFLNYVYNNFQGNTNSSIAYSMLQGLKNGSNYIANLQFSYILNKIFKINIQYSLRYSNTSTPVHSLSFNIIGVL